MVHDGRGRDFDGFVVVLRGALMAGGERWGGEWFVCERWAC
jgi:hypothetical protein